MPRGPRPNLEPSLGTHLMLPESTRTRLDLLLFSESQQRVPKGAYRQFFMTLLDDFFASKQLDLSPYVGSLPGERLVRGTPTAIDALVAAFEYEREVVVSLATQALDAPASSPATPSGKEAPHEPGNGE